MLLSGTGNGQFTVPTVTLPLPPNPVSLVTADFGGSDILFAGFASGEIDALIPTGYPLATPFTDVNTGVMITGGIANLDFNPQEHYLLALKWHRELHRHLLLGWRRRFDGRHKHHPLRPAWNRAGGPFRAGDPVGQRAYRGADLDQFRLPARCLGRSKGTPLCLSSSTTSNEALKNFVPVIEGTTSGVAAVGGSLEHFAFSDAGGPFADVSLPFSGKKVGHLWRQRRRRI